MYLLLHVELNSVGPCTCLAAIVVRLVTDAAGYRYIRCCHC